MPRKLSNDTPSAKVREYSAANPRAKGKEIAAALGLRYNFVAGVLWKDRKRKLKESRKAKAAAKPVVKVATPVPAPVLTDMVNRPPHYVQGGIEVIDFIEAKRLNYNLGNVVKYIARADHKGSREQDLQKAMWYLKRELSVINV